MSEHDHAEYVVGCPRCDLSRDEVASDTPTDPVNQDPDWRVRMGLTHAAHPWIARAAHGLLMASLPDPPGWVRRLWDWASSR